MNTCEKEVSSQEWAWAYAWMNPRESGKVVSLHLSHWPPAQQMVTEIICNAFFMSLKEMLQKLFMEVNRYYSFVGSPCPLK